MESRLQPVQTHMVARLVGFHEYTQAIVRFEQLVAASSPQELAVADEIISSHDELAIYTNLSSRIERYPSRLSEKPAADAKAKRGLAWLMGLARVELGAMAAGFTDHSSPFDLVPVTAFEREQHFEMLLDGARMHYWALHNDPIALHYANWSRTPVVSLARGTPLTSAQGGDELRAIAYARRVAIANEFVEAVARQYGNQLDLNQQAELTQWHRELSKLQSRIVFDVLGLGRLVMQQSNTTSDGGERWLACGRLVAIAKDELASGKAQVRKLR